MNDADRGEHIRKDLHRSPPGVPRHPSAGGNARFGSPSAALLTLCGLVLVGMGVYFMVFRPPLLPEDIHYIGADPVMLAASAPGLVGWLHKVFWVLGGYISAAGVLTIFVARTALPARVHGSLGVIVLAGAASVASMAATNFVINSDFKWPLLALALLWATATILYWRGR